MHSSRITSAATYPNHLLLPITEFAPEPDGDLRDDLTPSNGLHTGGVDGVTTDRQHRIPGHQQTVRGLMPRVHAGQLGWKRRGMGTRRHCCVEADAASISVAQMIPRREHDAGNSCGDHRQGQGAISPQPRRGHQHPCAEQLVVGLVSIWFVGGSHRDIRRPRLLNGSCVMFGPDSDIVHDFTH
jgi:hypothetical protein